MKNWVKITIGVTAALGVGALLYFSFREPKDKK